MNIAEQLQTVADNLATEHQEISAQEELLQQVKANLGGKAVPRASTSLYRHQIHFGDPDDLVLYSKEGHECSPHLYIEIYNRNPNPMEIGEIVEGGHFPYASCPPFWISDWDTVDDTCQVIRLNADENVSKLYLEMWNPKDQNGGYFTATFNFNDFYVQDTVTEV